MCCMSTHKLKLLVVCLTLLVQIDGELKAATNATLLLYYGHTKFLGYLVTRIILGIFLAAWAFTGFLSLFYDSVWGLATYSSGICFLTLLDLFTLYYRFLLRNHTYIDDKTKLERRSRMQRGIYGHDALDEGIGDTMLLVINIVQVTIQVSVNIAGWWLAIRLKRHHRDEQKYEADKMYLEYLLKSHPHTQQQQQNHQQQQQQQQQQQNQTTNQSKK